TDWRISLAQGTESLGCHFALSRNRPHLLRGREALPAQPENRFSARSGIVFVDGRQSRYGKSPDDSPHDSPATLH
ncbi:hypothetical protein, partial [Raoultella ornithinolytica]|uniref:hypothetical protein n=1 Tax=Raoultella ornithinolytica TaxID=54291 RepID=UPI00292C092F